MISSIRSLVSENRKRYIDRDVNLDLSYITDRIIAMSYPSGGLEGLYRNSLAQVKRFLDTRHSGHYKVYNLRREKQYDLSRFENAANYPFLDHQAPPFHVLVEFCSDAAAWLQSDPDNIAAIHCKAGKGRTGTVIAALMLHTGLAKDATEAIQIYGEKRTHNMKGITIPSQIRYVEYYDFMLKHATLYESNKDKSIRLAQVVVHDLPESLKNNKEFVLRVHQEDGVCIHYEKSTESEIDRTLDTILINTMSNQCFTGDFQVAFLNTKGKILFSFWLNATFVYIMSNNVVYLKKEDIDIAYHDETCKEFRRDFSVNLTFSREDLM